MILSARLTTRVQLVSTLFVLLMVPFATFAAGHNRSKKSVRVERRVPVNGRARSAGQARSQKTLSERETQSSRRHLLSARELRAERRHAASQQAFAARRHRIEVARQAAIARQRALDDAMRNEVHSMIARDDSNGEDPEVRRVAVSAPGNHVGTVVVMDPKTGRVYTIVNQEWALRRGFKPCSTIKLVTGLAGLNEKVIDPLEPTKTSGAYHLNLTDALAYSNNVYFQQVGGRVGFEKMIAYARQLGLGQKTGINSPDEFSGRVPLFKSGFAVNHMSSHGDDFQVTAIQLATLVSALANGGNLLSPYVPRNSRSVATLTPRVRRQLKVDADALTHMVPGMVGSVNYGSGRRAFNSEETVVGKTGTCIGEGAWVGLFTSYAPLNNPRLAVVVIARGPDAHGHFPAAVAGQIYRGLSSRFGTPTNLQIAMKPNTIKASEKVDPKSLLDEEDTEADEAESEETNVVAEKHEAEIHMWRPARNAEVTVPNKVKRVLMPIVRKTDEPRKATNDSKSLGQRPRLVTGGRP
jgi:penicillin-binding protein 2